ncbi:nucleoside triphosphate pyrophosphohydrolase [Caviibacterium pharyngocola]|uniref:Nucleoside triphosphate pyrophosphohydrolase n=1 Tax=Caviibacterium pharyngocola TaxID=28159 RepID=A0A2M8RU72_9PAST|nr:nucleoside triphosphate pyrophosphohydrolase [Caviibacterium pharyngocola]PJG82427.1 nucleoside triphosphate pyrophosphohydrolase [Caviibacterium pharyngocola]
MYSVNDLIQLMAKLRDPNGGCPWDLKQNFRTMIPCLIEETYETVEAIEQNNPQDLKEELGDLLLLIAFFSQLATEEHQFTFNDVVQGLCEKIIRRHPHVFGSEKAEDEQAALQNWNAVKADENKQKGHQSILDNIPFAFPALVRAEKLQKRCAKIGFDWSEIAPVFAKVQEELEEVRQEWEKPTQDPDKIAEEIGDLLFAAVNLSRHLKCAPEESLRRANLKFERRFRAVEQKLHAQNKTFDETSLVEMDILWDEVKKAEKQQENR